jgi:hypothetical protein
MELPVCTPSVIMPYGMVEEQTTAPNALTIYDEDVSPHPPDVNVAPDDDNGTHSDMHELPAVQRQVTKFMFDGVVANECKIDGAPAPCLCSTGACD